MKMKSHALAALLVLMACLAPGLALSADQGKPIMVEGRGLRCAVAASSGLPVWLESHAGERHRVWLNEPAYLAVRSEVSELSAQASGVRVEATSTGGVHVTARLEPLKLDLSEQWSGTASGLVWDLSFDGDAKRAGHKVTIDLPILSPDLRIFTPSNDGTSDLATRPTYRPVPYAYMGWDTGQAYVLPLVTVMDGASDQALTVALPPDRNIPHFQVEWIAAKTLRLTLAHRAMGGGKASSLRLLFYSHPADYRGTLKAYSDDFPEYFKPVLRHAQDEGAFWYHHIQDHPDFAEMARQNVRYIWSSFWFTHLGEYLPDTKEWFPYTYANWWKLGQTMSDEKINAFIHDMQAHGISVYAYLNLTEYGGAGDKGGNSSVSDALLKQALADALMKDVQNRPIPTWEGAYAMNARPAYSLWPRLAEQVRRHLERLPDLAGFIIDRLDWASQYDYGHDDGETMVGDRPVDNMSEVVGPAVQNVCRLAHAAHRRVLVNQFYRIEVLRDVDGYCHENDYLPALAYLAPYRPAAAWHMRQPYDGDLLEFEGQLKQRLQFALLPQMIAHQFPISQQKASPAAADLLELYAPLFATLAGKEQVLIPHCVAVSGENDVNLFVNGEGRYLAPVTSRARFRSRGANSTEAVRVTLRVPDASALAWAHVISADGPAYPGRVTHGAGGAAIVQVARHGTASMVVVGKGAQPGL